MTAPLEGLALFDDAHLIVSRDPRPIVWLFDAQWQLVPAMLEWLRPKGSLTVCQHAGDPDTYTEIRQGRSGVEVSEDPDLPTALARLVLRVAELEGKA